jgi:hypothetical protein
MACLLYYLSLESSLKIFLSVFGSARHAKEAVKDQWNDAKRQVQAPETWQETQACWQRLAETSQDLHCDRDRFLYELKIFILTPTP